MNKEFLINVTLPPLNRYIFFQLAKFCSIFYNTTSQIDLDLNETPKERPKSFIESWDILHSNMLAMLSIFGMFSNKKISDLAKFTFNSKIASKH